MERVSSGISWSAQIWSASSRAAVTLTPLVLMMAMSKRLAICAALSSGSKPSFSMNSRAPKLCFGP
jgi:hypothetical protein